MIYAMGPRIHRGGRGYLYEQKYDLRSGYLALMDTPWKINMEHTNHPFGKENDLPNLHDYVPC